MSAANAEQSIFLAALELLTAAERLAYLQDACGTDLALLSNVRELLAAHDKGDRFLDRPPLSTTVADQAVTEQPGTVIGPYKLIKQIGEGGMGLVFVAEQTQPVRRKVALKVIKPGMDSRQVVARFEAERQALALMDHPHIAKVFDGGTTPSGRPYFVMELVKGVAVTQFCDENRLTTRERLGLFVDVCQAAQHAHTKGVIHRDIKPSNVLAASHDGTPVVKVIDFGVAKAIGQALTDKTIHTQLTQMVGTPLYMSPEQAGQSGLDIDTRTDVYALGVLLYELLTGTTPFDGERLRQAGFDEMRRIIREEEPPKPSARIGTLGPAANSVSAHRQSDPKRLSRLVRGELDWIVMKALEKDRNRRYETANEFARDVQRYLADEPVQAGPPSTWYRFRKLARRNKGALASVATIGLLLLTAVAILSISNARITWEQQETTKANAELQTALGRERRLRDSIRLELAHRHWAAGAIDDARRELGECDPEFRDQQWRRLHRLCHSELLRIDLGKEADFGHRIVFSPDGTRMAGSCLPNQPIRVWDATTGDEIASLGGYSGRILAMRFTDAWQLVVVSQILVEGGGPRDIEIHAYNVTSGKRIETWTHPVPGTVVAYLSPDGKRFATWNASTIRIAETTTGKALVVRKLDDFKASRVFFSPDWVYFAVNRDVRSVAYALQIRETTRGEVVRTIEDHANAPNPIEFSADGSRLTCFYGSVAIRGTEVRSWDVKTGTRMVTKPFRDVYSAPALSPDGQRIALVQNDAVVVWDLAADREVLTLRGHGGRVVFHAFHPDGLRLATVSAEGTLRLWDVRPIEDSPDAAP